MTKLNGMDADTSRYVADHLVILTDQLSEALAELRSDVGADGVRVESALHTVWEMRWELGISGGHVLADLGDSGSEAAQ